MACTSSGCGKNIDFDIEGGLCVAHYVVWCLALEKNDLTPEQYQSRYAELFREVTDHMRVMDVIEDVRALINDSSVYEIFEGDTFVDLLAAAVKSYDNLYSTETKGQTNGLLS